MRRTPPPSPSPSLSSLFLVFPPPPPTFPPLLLHLISFPHSSTSSSSFPSSLSRACFITFRPLFFPSSLISPFFIHPSSSFLHVSSLPRLPVLISSPLPPLDILPSSSQSFLPSYFLAIFFFLSPFLCAPSSIHFPRIYSPSITLYSCSISQSFVYSLLPSFSPRLTIHVSLHCVLPPTFSSPTFTVYYLVFLAGILFLPLPFFPSPLTFFTPSLQVFPNCHFSNCFKLSGKFSYTCFLWKCSFNGDIDRNC